MSNQLAFRIAAIMRGDYQKTPVMPVTPVTASLVTGVKLLKLQELHGLQVKNDKLPNDVIEPVTGPVTFVSSPSFENIVAKYSHVPAIYRAQWAALVANCPAGIYWQYREWAIRDGKDFFAGPHGKSAADLGWKPEHIFALPSDGRRGGLLWALRGAEVRALAHDAAIFDGGEIFDLLEFDRVSGKAVTP